MQVLPHIDVVEPERIDFILRDEANYVWRAIDCETLGSWTPDLGVTPYPVHSIYRAPDVANSGQSSTLRHRFWDTIYTQRNHVGALYRDSALRCSAARMSVGVAPWRRGDWTRRADTP